MLTVDTACPARVRGMTMIELLATLGAISILMSVVVLAVTPLLVDVRKVKLDNDVATINAAVKSFLTEGGDLTSATTAAQVIAALKSKASDQEIVAGYRGAFVDPRLNLVMQSDAEASEPNWRAQWDDTIKAFVVLDTGTAGIKEFILEEAMLEIDHGEDVRDNMNKLAKEDDWIWDFAATTTGPGLLSQSMPMDDPDEAAAPANPDELDQLLPPGFTPEGDLFEFFSFPSSVALSNPNDPSATQIVYSVNSGTWQIYSTPIPLTRGDYVSAFVEPKVYDPEIFNSFTATESYRADEPSVSGSSTGVFKDAVGSNRLVSSIAPGDSDSEFLYGRAFAGGDQNRLKFEGDSFSSIRPDTDFTVGTLTYLNSTTGLGTSAYEVTLQIDLNFSTPNKTDTVDVNLALESTANYPWLTADQKADFVRFGDLHTDFTTFFEGETYYLNLEFAYSGTDGYSTVDSFHVHEGKDASAQVIGYFSTTPNEKPDTSQGSTSGALPPPPGLP